MESNTDESLARASSESALMRRIGCVAGTRDSGDISINIDDCFEFSPRMGDLDHGTALVSIPATRPFAAAC
jgi:hypothetical protein